MDDKAILAAISAHESNDNPNAVGKSGEIGKYQFMPDTIKQLGADPKKLKGNAALQDQLALKHFQSLKDQFGEDTDKIIAAWNAGPGGVRQAEAKGGDWRKNLPKGTNSKGVQYDAGAYLSRVKERLGPQQPQMAQAPQVEAPETPSTPSPRRPMGAEQRIAQAYTKGKQVDIEKWAEEYAGQAQSAEPAAPKPEQKPQEAGGFFNSAGSAFKSVGKAVSGLLGVGGDKVSDKGLGDLITGGQPAQPVGQVSANPFKPVADAIYPPAPVEGAGLVRRAVEGAVGTMGGGLSGLVQGVGDLLAPSSEESARRKGLDPLSGAKEFGGKLLQGAMGAINATPVGGLMGAAAPLGEAAQRISPPDMSDEALKAGIEEIKAAMVSGGLASADPRTAEKLKEYEALLMSPMDKRLEYIEQRVKEAGEEFAAGAGFLPLPMGLGAGKALTGAFKGAQAGAKGARVAAVAKAGEEAVTAGAKPANAAEKLEILKQSPEAAAAIDETLSQYKPTHPMWPEGTKSVLKSEPQVPDGMTRLYRAEMPDGKGPLNFGLPEELAGRPESKFFSTDKEEVLGWVDASRGIAKARYIDLPSDEVAAYLVKQDAKTAMVPVERSGAPLSGNELDVKPDLVTVYRHGGVKGETAFFGESEGMVAPFRESGPLHSIEIPAAELEQFRVSNILNDPNADPKVLAEAKKLTEAGQIGMPEREYILPANLAKKAEEHTGAKGLGTRATMADPNVSPEAKAALRKELGIADTEATMPLYKDTQEMFQGDTDMIEALLKERGYKLPDFGLRENADIHQALDLVASAPPRMKAWAQEAAISVSHDIGMVPEAAVEALPAVGKIIKGLSKSDAEALREVVAAGVNDAASPLSALRSSQLVGAGQEGKVSAGVLFVMGRATIGGALGAMTGEDPESSVRNALLAAGVSSILSPKLAKTIVASLNDPAIRDGLKKAIMLHGEDGAMNLRFPSRGVGKEPSPNTANMGVGQPAKALVRGINEKLQKLDLLDRAKVQTHEMTIEAARHSQYNTVEKVLSLDSAKLSLDELASSGLAARSMRDFVAERVIQTAARAKLNPGDIALADEVVSKVALTGKLSQQVTNLETAYARATNALGIMTDTSMASKFDLSQFAGDLEAFKGALTAEGKVSPTQLVEMITKLADKAATAKIATVASKWPEALWNIYYGLNLLASPLTHARNIIGNTGALGIAVLDRAGGEMLGPIFRIAGKKQTVARGETYDMVAAMYEIVSDSFRAGGDKMGAFGYFNEARTTGKSAFGASKYTEALAAAEASMQAGKGTLPWVVQTMSTLGAKNMGVMTGVDEFFKVLSFQAEMRALARRGSQHLTGKARAEGFRKLMDEPTTDMLHGATEFAKENTFTKAFKPGTDGGWRTVWGLGASVETAANNPFMKVLATPFYRTPMRIGEFSTVHTPILNFMAPQFWSDMAAGGVKGQLAISKVMTGTAIMGSMGWYAAHGYITGIAPSDPNLRKKMELAGWQEKSIYNPINGKYISYDNIEPISTIMGTIATFIQSAPDMDDHSIQTIFSAGVIALSKNILNKQWFTGLQDWSDALQAISQGEDAGALVKVLSRRAATLIPGASVFRTVQNATDPVKRDTQTVEDNENPELREFEKLVHIFAQSTPGWGGRNALELAGYKPKPAAINGITGETIANENQWLGFVNPFRVTSLKNDPVLNELVALDGAGLPQELIPRVLGGSQAASPFKLQGDEMRSMKEGVKLSDEERHRLGVLLTSEVTDFNGDTMHEAMAREIETEEYADEKDGRSGGKAYKLASIYNQFLAEASDKLREEYPAIDIAIQRRQVERDGGRLPKSMEWLQDSAREMAGQSMR